MTAIQTAFQQQISNLLVRMSLDKSSNCNFSALHMQTENQNCGATEDRPLTLDSITLHVFNSQR